MGAVKMGVIPRDTPLVKKCTRIISIILGHISRITSRNFADVLIMCAGLLSVTRLLVSVGF